MSAVSPREETLRCLLALIEHEQQGSCYGSDRAEALLRAQSSRDELVSLGVAEAVVDLLWPPPEQQEAAAVADATDE